LCLRTKRIYFFITSQPHETLVPSFPSSPEMFPFFNGDDTSGLPTSAKEIYLCERPETSINSRTFGTRTVALASDIPPGYVLVRVLWLSVDPAMRGWLSTEKNYIPPVRIGATMRASGVGEVLKSSDEDISVGSIVTGLIGWCDYCVTSGKHLTIAPSLPPSLPRSILLGALGTDICRRRRYW